MVRSSQLHFIRLILDPFTRDKKIILLVATAFVIAWIDKTQEAGALDAHPTAQS